MVSEIEMVRVGKYNNQWQQKICKNVKKAAYCWQRSCTAPAQCTYKSNVMVLLWYI